MKRFTCAPFAIAAIAAAACGSSSTDRKVGQSDFVSAPPLGSPVVSASGPRSEDAATGAPAAGSAPTTPAASAAAPRTVEETDLYRLEGNRLYFLNGYRGLMVFDVTDVDHPALIGRSPIYGSPVDMIVRNGVAIVVVADWYGQLDDGTPFHGSVVRGLDATDPAHIKVLGEAKLGGWVRDDRVVGDVIYAVSEDYGWSYGWDTTSTSTTTETVIVSSVSFANNTIAAVGRVAFPGYSGVFNVTPSAILLAHDALTTAATGGTGGSPAPTETAANDGGGGAAGGAGGKDGTPATAIDGGSSGGSTGNNPVPALRTQLLYLDISDPAGQIVQRGSLVVDGQVQGWGADNGRWNLDFSDGKTARIVGCNGQSGGWPGYTYTYCSDQSSYVLSIVDFGNPDAPVLSSKLDIPAIGWAPAVRFDSNRLYLSPSSSAYFYGTRALNRRPSECSI